MRPNPNQESGEQQKKSVFDRLGRQLDTSRSHNRRSPAQYVEYPMHPNMHEPPELSASRYIRGEGHPEVDWRYQSDRRHMQYGRERHASQLGLPQPPPPQMPHPQQHYDMESVAAGIPPGRQPPPYYQHPAQLPPHYSQSPLGPPPQLMGSMDTMAMHHQRRASPKYDRHGNLIRGSMMAPDHPENPHSPRNFMGPPMPMLPPVGPYEMVTVRPDMYQQNRWHDGNDLGPNQMPGMRMLAPDDRFIGGPNRFHQQQSKPAMLLNSEAGGLQVNFEAPRYSKWRERRDVITNLDRQTAQSSSKTDSLKSSLQQSDHKGHSRRSRGSRAGQANRRRQAAAQALEAARLAEQEANKLKKEALATKNQAKKVTVRRKVDPQDISDGEIIDDEDSSDESDDQKELTTKNQTNADAPIAVQGNRLKSGYGRKPPGPQPPFYEPNEKRRRLLDRVEYSMDYETISDEELEDFMSDKKIADGEEGGDDSCISGKHSSEVELLNALGLDWANLIELSKVSRKEASTSDSALRSFSLPKFLPTLGITKELAGPELHDLILKIAH